MKNAVQVVGFDADDTLWVDVCHFQETEAAFLSLVGEYLPAEEISKDLFETHVGNLSVYGYGAKGYALSMIETACRISGGRVQAASIEKIIELGKQLLEKPVSLLAGVEAVIADLKERYTLILATKGDLVDQERKLAESGLAGHFDHIEIMSDKKEANYEGLFRQLELVPAGFTMIGNSLKSDIRPVLNLGGYGIHVPFHTTWRHEQLDGESIESKKFFQVDTLHQVLTLL